MLFLQLTGPLKSTVLIMLLSQVSGLLQLCSGLLYVNHRKFVEQDQGTCLTSVQIKLAKACV